jgi:predicted ATPase/DNA-binding winged helix-turn-helix (wHTH) protein
VSYRFGAFEIDFQLFELRRGSDLVRIDRKVFDLLRYLIEQRERVVDKHELLQHVWGGEVVVEAVVTTAVARLRKVLGQRGGEGGPIQTVHGRGYRFNAPLDTHVAPVVVVKPQAKAAYVDTDLHPGLRDPFVGRQALMQRLNGALDRALSGSVRVRLLVGEPGAGKTRLCHELASRARQAGARVWVGRCYEADRGEMLWPWVQLLRQAVDGPSIDALRALPPPLMAELATLVPELGTDATPREITLGGSARLPLFDAINRFLRAASQPQPLVLILDDLHWADQASLSLLSFLLEELGDARILILGTFRDAELPPGHPHLALLDRMERSSAFKRIAVEPLFVPDVEEYLGAITGRPPPPMLAERLHERTAGNPFFVRETVRSLTWEALSEGHLDIAQVRLPESARDVIRRRFALLPEPAQRALRAASVIGVRFEMTTLAAMLDLETPTLLAALDRAISARQITRESDGVGCYAFAHALIRDTIYDDLPTTSRCELHLQVGAALEQQRSVRPAATSEVAFHLHAALPQGDGNRVFEYGVKAAEQAAAASDHELEAFWYGRAYEGLRFAAEANPDRSAELMLALGRAHRASGHPAEARQALGRVIELSSSGAAESWAERAQEELEALES